jgi:hypothetical protein
MGGLAENLTAANGERDDHNILHDMATQFGANRDNETLPQFTNSRQ